MGELHTLRRRHFHRLELLQRVRDSRHYLAWQRSGQSPDAGQDAANRRASQPRGRGNARHRNVCLAGIGRGRSARAGRDHSDSWCRPAQLNFLKWLRTSSGGH